ncbi:MAG: hypothetical protein LBV15_05935 [Planctomycetota bacterium]|jgi:hypothetical protein|nr:hypothetical protein [Planctomycetota bacterium]
MRHRHLDTPDGVYTLPAIESIIERGGKEDWARLYLVVKARKEVRDRVFQAARAQLDNPYTIRYHFWRKFALFCRKVADGQ